jgi:SAM-dependent methyltransferase
MRKVVTAIISRTFDAVFRPARRQTTPRSLFKRLMSAPVVFDISSIALQLRWLRSVQSIPATAYENDAHLSGVHAYNSNVTTKKMLTSTRRAEPVYVVAGLPSRNLVDNKLLIVGPRNVQEFLIAWMHGFSWKNIKAIDLYSTHPKIVVMDMHRVEFPDNSFDVVTMVNTLGYASDIKIVLEHVYRVVAPGGRFCFTHAHAPDDPLFAGDLVSGEAVLEMCRSLGFRTYFHHFDSKVNSRKKFQTTHLIGVEKPSVNAIAP